MFDFQVLFLSLGNCKYDAGAFSATLIFSINSPAQSSKKQWALRSYEDKIILWRLFLCKGKYIPQCIHIAYILHNPNGPLTMYTLHRIYFKMHAFIKSLIKTVFEQQDVNLSQITAKFALSYDKNGRKYEIAFSEFFNGQVYVL